MSEPDLSLFDNSWYSSGRSQLIEALWFLLGLPLVRCRIIPFSSVRSLILRVFGATVGRNVMLKPGIRVKYPWLLSLGPYCWIGEGVWIDNLACVTIGANVCVSQEAYLCTGNHDWSDPAFGLRVKPIILEDGCWVGARALICPGVRIERGGVAAAGSVITHDIRSFEIYGGNPAVFLRQRELYDGTDQLQLDIQFPLAAFERQHGGQ